MRIIEFNKFRNPRFTEAIKENLEIWQALNKSVKTSEMLELDKPPALKTLINEIFSR